MADWRYYVHRSKPDGEPMGELSTLQDVSIEDVLSGISTLTASLPLYEAQGARSLTAPWLREITAVRDGVIAFHGPIVARVPSLESQTVQISALSPMAYLSKRVTENPRKYTREQFSIVRSLVDDALAKTNGSLYRFAVTQNSSGVSKNLSVGGTERRYVSDLIEELSQDTASGFDYRWDYTWNSFPQKLVQRTLTLGYPTIGRDLAASVTVEATADLIDVTDSEDGLGAGNRVHVLGAGTGTKRLRAVSNSGTSINQGYPLLESVFDRSDVKDQSRLNGIAAALRNSTLPGTRGFSSKHTIGPHFPYGRVDLGDKVTVKLVAGSESVNVARRVVAVGTNPQEDSVSFSYFDPTDVS